MKKFIFAAALFLFCSAYSQTEGLILEQLKGVLLIPSEKKVQKEGVEGVEGFQSLGVEIPAGENEMNQQLSCKFIGLPLTKEALLSIKLEILKYYRAHGYPVVIVEIPEQNLKTGVLQLVVIISELENLKVCGNRWFFDSFYKNKFHCCEGGNIQGPNLLNDLAWINRNPFQNASVAFARGKMPDTTDVSVMVNDSFPVRFYAGGDNTGNDVTHNTRLFAGVNWGYAFFMNQILSYQYSTSTNFKSFWAHTIHYTAFLPFQHSIVLYGGLSGVEPKFNPFGGDGNSYQASMRYQIPFKPFYTPFSHEISFGFDFKRTNTNINFVPEESLEVIADAVNLFQLTAQYSLAQLWGKNELTMTAELFGSPGRWLPDQKNSEYQELGYAAKNAYIYGKGAFSYEHYLPKDFSLLWFLRGQASSANLLPSEDLGIGGYDTVRGYEERILNVANGIIFNFEAKSPKFPVFAHRKKIQDQMQFLLFFDYGAGNYTKSVPGLSNWLQIFSIGPGVRYRIQNYLSFRFDWGYQLKKAPFSGPKNKAHFGLLLSY
ncbi:MAG: hypothetical protein K1X28_04805 [Parachlamydiales bacterium]|nr:hypothetical protein [Parachlamydiales bacterium]